MLVVHAYVLLYNARVFIWAFSVMFVHAHLSACATGQSAVLSGVLLSEDTARSSKISPKLPSGTLDKAYLVGYKQLM